MFAWSACGRWRERKHIAITLEPISDELQLTGDRELMEYACYNLLTNAVKYSPQRTEVTDLRLEGRRPYPHRREGPGHRHGSEGGQADFSKVLPHQKSGRIRRSRHRNRAFHRPTDRGTAWRGGSRWTSEPGEGLLTLFPASVVARHGTALMQKILLVEDDPALQFTILTALEEKGYAVDGGVDHRRGYRAAGRATLIRSWSPISISMSAPASTYWTPPSGKIRSVR